MQGIKEVNIVPHRGAVFIFALCMRCSLIDRDMKVIRVRFLRVEAVPGLYLVLYESLPRLMSLY